MSSALDTRRPITQGVRTFFFVSGLWWVISVLQKGSSCPSFACSTPLLRSCQRLPAKPQRAEAGSTKAPVTHTNRRTQLFKHDRGQVQLHFLHIDTVQSVSYSCKRNKHVSEMLSHSVCCCRKLTAQLALEGDATGKFAYSSPLQTNGSARRCTPCAHQLPEWDRWCWISSVCVCSLHSSMCWHPPLAHFHRLRTRVLQMGSGVACSWMLLHRPPWQENTLSLSHL